MTKENTFGINLKAFRESHNMTLRDLSKKAGVAAGSLSNYENGKQPTLEVAENIAEVFGVSLSKFLVLDSEQIGALYISKSNIQNTELSEVLGEELSEVRNKNDNTSHKEGNSYEIEALKKSLEDKERIIAMLEQRVSDKEELNQMLRSEVDRLKNELQGYKSGE